MGSAYNKIEKARDEAKKEQDIFLGIETVVIPDDEPTTPPKEPEDKKDLSGTDSDTNGKVNL